jgi:hypothetical protein
MQVSVQFEEESVGKWSCRKVRWFVLCIFLLENIYMYVYCTV